jgi:hypothetical protein
MARLVALSKVKERLDFVLHGKMPRAGTDYLFSDNQYTALSTQELNELFACVKLPAFQGQVFDCDDFAFVFKGEASRFGLIKNMSASPCVGMAWGYFKWNPEYHAVNWVILEDERFLWIEPQHINKTGADATYDAAQCERQVVVAIV